MAKLNNVLGDENSNMIKTCFLTLRHLLPVVEDRPWTTIYNPTQISTK